MPNTYFCEALGNKIKKSREAQKADFWGHYITLYRRAWDVAPQSLLPRCPALYTCVYKEIVAHDKHMLGSVAVTDEASEFLQAADAATCSQWA